MLKFVTNLISLLMKKSFPISNKNLMKDSIAILCGGGPALGINAVISTLTKKYQR